MNHMLVEFARFQNQFPHAGNFALLLMKSTAILVMAVAVSALLQQQSARARNWVWRCAFAGLLGLAIWESLPGSQSLVTVQATPTSFPTTAPAMTVSANAQSVDGLLLSGDAQHPRPNAIASTLAFVETWALWLWLGVAGGLVLIHSLRSAGATLWLKRHAVRVETSDENGLAGMDVYRTPALETPLLAGLLRPAIYLPESSTEWTQEKRRCVLLHEKAHRTRRDLGWQFAATCTACLWWWNPLSWMALARLKAEAEQAADDLVVLHEGTAEPYARHLVEIAAGFTRPAPVGVPMLGRSPLEQRIRAILNRTLLRDRIGSWSGSLLGVLACGILLSLTVGVALGDVDVTNKHGQIVHYQADPAQNKLAQGNFAKTGGKLDGWTGSLGSVSSPEKGMIQLRATEQEAAIETTLPCDPSWQWLTLMAKTRPAGGGVFDEGQDASITFTPVDASGQGTAPATVLKEKRRDGYVNWANWIRTIPVPAGSHAVHVRISLAPGKGGLDCQEIGIVPTRAEDELDHRLVDRFGDALKASDQKTVLALLKQEPKLVGARGFTDNGTPLILCAWNELPEMARILIDHGADLEAVDYGAWRSTALMWCGWWGSAKTADVLIKAGADAKKRSINGVTPLSSAKNGKKNNRYSKASPEAYDQTIALLTAAAEKP